MRLTPFKLERYFAKYEFNVNYSLCSSDCDGLSQKELLEMADKESKKLWDNLSLGYTESLGLPLLRKEISKLYKDVSLDQVIISAPQEGIFLALNAILKKGDHVICTFPAYQSLYEVAKGLGCLVTLWKGQEKNGWRFDPEFLKENIKSNTKLIVINFPHNPTGFVPTKQDFNKIIEIAREKKIYIFSDEMYRFLEIDPKDRLPALCEVYDKSVTLSGMSKVFGMAGVRIGWLVTKDKNIYERLAELKDYTTICSSAPSEILSLIALRNKDKILENHHKKITKNLSILEDFFNRHRDVFIWVKPKGGTVCFPRIKNKIGSFKFCEEIIKDAGIMLLPSKVYDFDDHHFRIAFGRENIPEVLTRFETHLERSKLFRRR